MVTIKLKIIGMDRAVNPDFLEAISNARRSLATAYPAATPFEMDCAVRGRAGQAVLVELLLDGEPGA